MPGRSRRSLVAFVCLYSTSVLFLCPFSEWIYIMPGELFDLDRMEAAIIVLNIQGGLG